MLILIHGTIKYFACFVAFCLQGRRPTMEDRFVLTEVLSPSLNSQKYQSKEQERIEDLRRRRSVKIYAVLDGHGGEV